MNATSADPIQKLFKGTYYSFFKQVCLVLAGCSTDMLSQRQNISKKFQVVECCNKDVSLQLQRALPGSFKVFHRQPLGFHPQKGSAEINPGLVALVVSSFIGNSFWCSSVDTSGMSEPSTQNLLNINFHTF